MNTISPPIKSAAFTTGTQTFSITIIRSYSLYDIKDVFNYQYAIISNKIPKQPYVERFISTLLLLTRQLICQRMEVENNV